MKSGVGVKVTVAPTRVTVPPVGLDTAVTVGVVPSGSVSLAVRSVAGKLSGVSSLVDLVSSMATGASLSMLVTVTVTVAVSVSPAASLMV